VATLKERNYRSFAMLQSLGFERSGSNNSGEVVMRKGGQRCASEGQAD
jgi:hypothetical protein